MLFCENNFVKTPLMTRTVLLVFMLGPSINPASASNAYEEIGRPDFPHLRGNQRALPHRFGIFCPAI